MDFNGYRGQNVCPGENLGTARGAHGAIYTPFGSHSMISKGSRGILRGESGDSKGGLWDYICTVQQPQHDFQGAHGICRGSPQAPGGDRM